MTQQLKVVNLKCANCGGALEITSDMERFACGYCGSEQIVERRGGTIGLRLIVDGVARVQVGTDKTAAELALVRLEKELATAHAHWNQEDQVFRMRHKPYSDWAQIVSMLCFLIFVIGGVIFVNADNMRLVILTIFLAGGGVVGLIWAVKDYWKSRMRYPALRSEFLSSHEKHIRLIEQQIAKARRAVQS